MPELWILHQNRDFAPALNEAEQRAERYQQGRGIGHQRVACIPGLHAQPEMHADATMHPGHQQQGDLIESQVRPLQPEYKHQEGVGVLDPRKHIARAAHCQNAQRSLRIAFDDGTNARDMHVDRAVERVQRFATDQIHQLLARQYAAGTFGHGAHQGELVVGQVADLAIDTQAPCIAINLEPAKTQYRSGALVAGTAPATQHGANPCQQFTRLKRFGQIVVGAQFKADNAIGRIAARGQHQYRQVGFGADGSAYVEPVAVR